MSMLAAIAALALTMSAACGSKNKPTPTSPTGQSTATDTDQDRAVSSGAGTGQSEGAAATDPSAALQNVVYFEFDATDLDDVARAKLNENAAWLKEDSTRSLTIEGHTDEVGTTEYNLGLGHRRAQVAKDYLVRLGIDESRVRIISYGEERPASTEDAQNRRSMFIAGKKQ